MEIFKPWLADVLANAAEHRIQTGRPLVSLCYAQSLDGSLAARGGKTLRLSGPESMALTHRLRAAHDAILVGIGTILADDPSLTVRYAAGKNPQPVILDSRLRFPLDANLLSKNPIPPWLAAAHDGTPELRQKLESLGIQALSLPEESGHVSLSALLDELAKRGISSLMVEGGAQVLTAFLSQDLADWLCVTLAPRFVGGLNLLDSAGSDTFFPELEDIHYDRQGRDLIIFGRFLHHQIRSPDRRMYSSAVSPSISC